MKISSRTATIIALTVLSVAVVALIAYALVADNSISDLKDQIYQRANGAFEELIGNVDALGVKYVKLGATGDKEQAKQLLSDVWRDAAALESGVRDLPMREEDKRELTAFVNTSGDYAKQLWAKLERGEALSEQDYEQLTQVRNACAEVSAALNEAWSNGYQLDMDLGEFLSEEEGETRSLVREEYPRLIYDGPFSESAAAPEPVGVPAYSVTEQAALRTANEFAGIELAPAAHTGGDLPAYHFTGQTQAGEAVRVAVTMQGGGVLSWFLQAEGDGLTILPTERRAREVQLAAQKFLEQKGYPACEASYMQYYNGNALINMVPLQDGRIRLYADLIKVWVNMQTGEVVGMDATNYIMSHTDRTLEPPTVTEAQAREKLSDALEVEEDATVQAVIPLDNGTEAYCYEFLCELDDQDVIVYVDVHTGVERDLLAIRHTNNGTLVQ